MGQVICVSDGEGDFWDITPGKIYTVLKVNPEYVIYIRKEEDGTIIKNTTPRILIEDDASQGWYPLFCFKTLKPIKNIEDLL
ncbi:hypothetical protein ACFHWD_04280 [Clostridium sp. MT-14]|uniref:hypothetical protein n=1 Tax=Clostridium sp. MT-14 TaxID=3348360 RepID=UPI0035F24B0D